jgi:hypothetical protein|tara:strand:- start:2780 stop:3016 length:237 start_codon:yes stop_codon:yes gene_type:complete
MNKYDAALEEAYDEAQSLMRAMETCGFDGCHLSWTQGYWVLFVEGVITLAYQDECPLEAIEGLHERIVDTFYVRPILA